MQDIPKFVLVAKIGPFQGCENALKPAWHRLKGLRRMDPPADSSTFGREYFYWKLVWIVALQSVLVRQSSGQDRPHDGSRKKGPERAEISGTSTEKDNSI